MTARRLMLLACAAAALVVVVAGIDLGRAPQVLPSPAPPVVHFNPAPEGEERLPEPRPAPTAAPRPRGRPAPDADTAPPLPSADAPAAAVARAYAQQSVNWTAATLARQHRRLASLSAGPLREQNRAAAHDRAVLATLRSDGAGQRGRVHRVAIAPAHGGEVIAEVRTSERTYGRSLGPPRTRAGAYAARLARRSGDWHVIGWEVRR
jgi:hypothetical protein